MVKFLIINIITNCDVVKESTKTEVGAKSTTAKSIVAATESTAVAGFRPN